MPIIDFALLASAYPSETSLRHVTQWKFFRQTKNTEQNSEVMRCEELRLFDDHRVSCHVPPRGGIKPSRFDAQCAQRVRLVGGFLSEPGPCRLRSGNNRQAADARAFEAVVPCIKRITG